MFATYLLGELYSVRKSQKRMLSMIRSLSRCGVLNSMSILALCGIAYVGLKEIKNLSSEIEELRERLAKYEVREFEKEFC